MRPVLLLGKSIGLLLPGGAASMAPVLVARLLPSLNAPLGLGGTFRVRRISGAHKVSGRHGRGRGDLEATIAGSIDEAFAGVAPDSRS